MLAFLIHFFLCDFASGWSKKQCSGVMAASLAPSKQNIVGSMGTEGAQEQPEFVTFL